MNKNLLICLLVFVFTACSPNRSTISTEDKELIILADTLLRTAGLDTSDVIVVKLLNGDSTMILHKGSNAHFSIAFGNLEKMTHEVATGKRKFVVSTIDSGYLGAPIIVLPVMSCRPIMEAVFTHEMIHVAQGSGLSEVARELQAYTFESIFLQEAYPTPFKDFIPRCAEIYKKEGIATVHVWANKLCTDVLQAPPLETNILAPALMAMVAIEAGDTTAQKFVIFHQKLSAFIIDTYQGNVSLH